MGYNGEKIEALAFVELQAHLAGMLEELSGMVSKHFDRLTANLAPGNEKASVVWGMSKDRRLMDQARKCAASLRQPTLISGFLTADLDFMLVNGKESPQAGELCRLITHAMNIQRQLWKLHMRLAAENAA